MSLKTKKCTIPYILFIVLFTGCASKEQLPVSLNANLNEHLVTSTKTDELPTKNKPLEGIHNVPPSHIENVSYKEKFTFSEYIIGPSDVLTITDWKSTGATDISTTVRPDGKNILFFFRRYQSIRINTH